MLTRDQIFDSLKAKGTQYVPVPFPERGEVWHAKILKPKDHRELSKGWDKHKDDGKQYAWFACCVLYEPETGKRIFNDLDIDNVDELFDAWMLQRIWDVAGTANGLTAKADEEFEKNSKILSGVTSSNGAAGQEAQKSTPITLETHSP